MVTLRVSSNNNYIFKYVVLIYIIYFIFKIFIFISVFVCVFRDLRVKIFNHLSFCFSNEFCCFYVSYLFLFFLKSWNLTESNINIFPCVSYFDVMLYGYFFLPPKYIYFIHNLHTTLYIIYIQFFIMMMTLKS